MLTPESSHLMDIALRVIAFIFGTGLVATTIMSSVKTFIMPRGGVTRITRVVFIGLRRLFDLLATPLRSYEQLDRLFALYAPIGLLLLPAVWLLLVGFGFTFIFWALGTGDLLKSYILSGSSLFTLGFATADGWQLHTLVFVEGAIGLALLALLISYLPTMYSAFSRRESLVTLLEVRAGTPPSPIEMLRRYNAFHGLDHLGEVWEQWETWFVEIVETHTSLAALAFFRSPQPYRSWVTAAGAVLDCAALTVAVVEAPPDPHLHLCIRAGYLALNGVAHQFGLTVPDHPTIEKNEISITREDFDDACEQLIAKGLTLKPDRDQAWIDFAGWRVNYDVALLGLSRLFIVPITLWSSDRAWQGAVMKGWRTNVARVMRQEKLGTPVA